MFSLEFVVFSNRDSNPAGDLSAHDNNAPTAACTTRTDEDKLYDKHNNNNNN